MQNFKEEKMADLLKELAAEFLHREGNGTSLVTVTHADLSDRFRTATIFFSVFPENKEEEALDFAKRKRTEFREFVSKKAKMRRLPRVDFEIDRGEKNRQRIDELSQGR